MKKITMILVGILAGLIIGVTATAIVFNGHVVDTSNRWYTPDTGIEVTFSDVTLGEMELPED